MEAATAALAGRRSAVVRLSVIEFRWAVGNDTSVIGELRGGVRGGKPMARRCLWRDIARTNQEQQARRVGRFSHRPEFTRVGRRRKTLAALPVANGNVPALQCRTRPVGARSLADVVRCGFCRLNQYRTSSGRCRNCRKPLPAVLPFVTGLPTAPPDHKREPVPPSEYVRRNFAWMKKERRWSSAEVARRADISPATLSKIASGGMVTIAVTEKLAGAFGVPVGWMVQPPRGDRLLSMAAYGRDLMDAAAEIPPEGRLEALRSVLRLIARAAAASVHEEQADQKGSIAVSAGTRWLQWRPQARQRCQHSCSDAP